MKHYIASAVVIAALTFPGAITEIPYQTPAPPPEPTLRKELVPICSCESNGRPDREPRQFNKDGSVLREDLKRLGLNPEKKVDNIIFANWLYERDGEKPWNWSRPCWK